MSLETEVLKRRTFAIISHPDAGKTTLTEQFLKTSGYVRVAGMVRAKRNGKFTVSDWMDIERERGISVSATALRLNVKDKVINLLDTPGHEDFSEDTLRTLLAADFAVMVVDCTRGIEAQTVKLFEVCSIRGIPVLTFINKLDLESKDFLELLDEIRSVLSIEPVCMNFPIGCGRNFKGVKARPDSSDPFDSRLLLELNPKPCLDSFMQGKQTFLFWGSALKGIGVDEVFNFILETALHPRSTTLAIDDREREIRAFDKRFFGLVFKIQSNIDKNYRSKTAYLKVLSGELERQDLYYNPRTGVTEKASRLHSMFAKSATTVDRSVAGDIVGLSVSENVKLGDILSSEKVNARFPGFPSFAPQVFAAISVQSTYERKRFDKAIEFFCSEALLLKLSEVGTVKIFFGAVGRLQFEVAKSRLENEFGISPLIEFLPYSCSVFVDLAVPLEKITIPAGAKIFLCALGFYVIAFKDFWQERYFKSNNQVRCQSIVLS